MLPFRGGSSRTGTVLLEQADAVTVLPQLVWDSSWILADRSLLGWALHTLVGYADRPMLFALYPLILGLGPFLMHLLAPRPAAPHRSLGRLCAVAFAALCLSTQTFPSDKVQAQSREVPEIRPGILAGYLPSKALPNSRTLLAPPPPERSVAFALDEEFSADNRNLRGTPRWDLATQDADLSFPNAAGTFSCALMTSISEQHTPHLYMLLRRSLADAGLSTYPAKNYYSRARPFLVNKEPICTPSAESQLAHDGSYPSGHAAIGWAWALILSEVAPDKTDALLARGRAFGQSRVVCNVHWQSDVLAGQIMGAGVVARLHADPTFLADLDAAKGELAAVRASSRPTRDCDSESAAIALEPQLAP